MHEYCAKLTNPVCVSLLLNFCKASGLPSPEDYEENKGKKINFPRTLFYVHYTEIKPSKQVALSLSDTASHFR